MGPLFACSWHQESERNRLSQYLVWNLQNSRANRKAKFKQRARSNDVSEAKRSLRNKPRLLSSVYKKNAWELLYISCMFLVVESLPPSLTSSSPPFAPFPYPNSPTQFPYLTSNLEGTGSFGLTVNVTIFDSKVKA